MEIIRIPGSRRPNSYEARVYSYLLQGVTKQTIEEETGIRGDRLTHTIKRIRSKYIGRLSPEQQVLEHRRNTSAGRGGILLAVSEYFPLDLTSRQTQIALEVDHGISLPQPKIAHVYAREMHRHGLQRPIAQLTIEAQRDKRRPTVELVRIVKQRKNAHSLIERSRLPKPQTLEEWSSVEQETDEIKNQLLDLLGKEELVPGDMLGCGYLLDLYQARRVWIENEDRSLIDNFPLIYEEMDSAIADRLEQQRQIIMMKIKPNGNGKKPVQVAESGEVKRGETGWG